MILANLAQALYALTRSITGCMWLFWSLLILTGCSSLPKDIVRENTYALTDTGDTLLARKVALLLAAHPNQSGFYRLHIGEEALAARIKIIQQAQKTVDAQYYIWHNDLVGKVIHEQLLQAADRGVRVRLLLDDMDTAGSAQTLRFIDAHPNIEVRLYNPFTSRTRRMGGFISDFARLNHRMHNKTLTVDNQATIFGGRNIGNEYFNATENVGFDDLDALAIGPVVKEVSTAFDEYWNSEWVYPLSAFKVDRPVTAEAIANYRKQSTEFISAANQSDYAAAVQEFSYNQLARMNLPFEWSEWQVAYDHPGKVVHTELTLENSLAPQLAQMARKANKDLIIVSPYFVPGQQLTKTIGELIAKGIRVRILTNSLASNDVGVVFAGYKKHRKSLLAAGVELYEFKATKSFKEQQAKDPNKKLAWKGAARASLHAKYFVFDLTNIFIGSFNLDSRSVAINTEFGVYFKSATYAQLVSQAFERHALDATYKVTLQNGKLQWATRDNGKTVYFDKEPDTNFLQRFGSSFSGLLVPEGQL